MPSLTVENYVKAIYQIEAKAPNEPVATGQLATALDVSPGTVTSMLKTLSDSGLTTYTRYEGVRLTDSGRALALRVLRRHRLIELFLVRTLELTWDEVHDEAEHMEHAVSDLLVDRIDAFLGHPRVDPHGDPIPRSDGTLAADPQAGQALANCAAGFAFRLVRVIDQSSKFLRYLTETGLGLGSFGRVTANRDEAGILTIKVDGNETTLAREAAEKLIVTEEKAERP